METHGLDKQLLQIAFGGVLRRYRQDVGLSQEKLALECGLDRTYISLLERGLRSPSLYTIFLLADHLKIDPAVMVNKTAEALQDT